MPLKFLGILPGVVEKSCRLSGAFSAEGGGERSGKQGSSLQMGTNALYPSIQTGDQEPGKGSALLDRRGGPRERVHTGERPLRLQCSGDLRQGPEQSQDRDRDHDGT